MGNSEKFDIEPISPKPGPTLLRHEMDAVKPVIMSQPNIVYITVPKSANKIYDTI
jgi:hypothetical protein